MLCRNHCLDVFILQRITLMTTAGEVPDCRFIDLSAFCAHTGPPICVLSAQTNNSIVIQFRYQGRPHFLQESVNIRLCSDAICFIPGQRPE